MVDRSIQRMNIELFEDLSQNLVFALDDVARWLQRAVPHITRWVIQDRWIHDDIDHGTIFATSNPWESPILCDQAIRFYALSPRFVNLRSTYPHICHLPAEGYRIAHRQFPDDATAMIERWGKVAHDTALNFCSKVLFQSQIAANHPVGLNIDKLLASTPADLGNFVDKRPFDDFMPWIDSFSDLKKAILMERDAILRQERKEEDRHSERLKNAIWHPCTDCLDPLVEDLRQFSREIRSRNDADQLNALEVEETRLLESCGNWEPSLSDEQQTKLRELRVLKQTLRKPLGRDDLRRIYERYNLRLLKEWLSVQVAVDYANEVQRHLDVIRSKYRQIDFNARQLVLGDITEDDPPLYRYPICLVENAFYRTCRELYADREALPDPDEFPEEVRYVWDHVVEPFGNFDSVCLEHICHLERASKVIKAKFGIPTLDEEPPTEDTAMVTKKRSPKAIPEPERKKTRQLVDDWNQAHSAGVSKAQFCKDHEIDVETLKAAQARVRTWNKRANKK